MDHLCTVSSVSLRGAESIAETTSPESLQTGLPYATSTPYVSQILSAGEHWNNKDLVDSGYSTVQKPSSTKAVISDNGSPPRFFLDSYVDSSQIIDVIADDDNRSGLNCDKHLGEHAGYSNFVDSGCDVSSRAGLHSKMSYFDSTHSNFSMASTSQSEAVRTESVVNIPSEDSIDSRQDCVDFIQLLNRTPHILQLLFRCLSPRDLLCMMSVCQKWNLIIHSSKKTLCRINKYKQEKRQSKENIGSVKLPQLKRPLTMANQPLEEIQSVDNRSESCGSQQQQHQSVSNRSRYDWFREEAMKLSDGERLSKCPRCDSPARTEQRSRRARCTEAKCKFDYCTDCEKPYHAPRPCAVVSQTAGKSGTVGSQKSRKNLRRL